MWPPAWVPVSFCCWMAERWLCAWGHPLVPRALRLRGLCGPAGCVLAVSGHVGTWWVRPVRRSLISQAFLGNKHKRSLWRTGKVHVCCTTQIGGGNERQVLSAELISSSFCFLFFFNWVLRSVRLFRRWRESLCDEIQHCCISRHCSGGFLLVFMGKLCGCWLAFTFNHTGIRTHQIQCNRIGKIK